MLLPTEKQRVWLVTHHAWNLRDEGMADDALAQRLEDEGVPPELASAIPKLLDQKQASCSDDEQTRQDVVQRVEQAVMEEDFEGVRVAMLDGVDDDRTLHKVYARLAELVVSDSHEQGTAAAYGLSFMVGLGDWPLLEALSHADEFVRYRAAFALGKMGRHARHAIPALEQVFENDADDLVRATAEEAIDSIRSSKPWWKFW
jgi:HEAT repeat protein